MIYIAIAALDLFALVQVMTGGGIGHGPEGRSRIALYVQPRVHEESVGICLGDRRGVVGVTLHAFACNHAPDET